MPRKRVVTPPRVRGGRCVSHGAHVKDLFEVQRYPEGDPPYDVAGWTLPLLLGVRRVELMEAVDAPLTEVSTADDAVAGVAGAGDGAELDSRDSDDWKTVLASLAEGLHVDNSIREAIPVRRATR